MFNLTTEEQQRVSQWYDSLKPEILEKQKEFNKESGFLPENEVYYGAIGGGLTYSFTPTGLGVICKVKEVTTQKELLVTDFTDW